MEKNVTIVWGINAPWNDDKAAAEEEVAYITTFAQTYGLDLTSIEISDLA